MRNPGFVWTATAISIAQKVAGRMDDSDIGMKAEDEKILETKKNIETVRRAAQGELGIKEVGAALAYIVEHESWKDVGYDSFGKFARASSKDNGLAINDLDAAGELRHYLLKNGLYELWAQLLELIRRPRGRPKIKLVNDEDKDKRQFYPASTALTNRDNLILKLRSAHPDEFGKACAGETSLLQAAVTVGIVKKKQLLCDILDLDKVAALKIMEQSKLVSHVFAAIESDAQCEFFRRRVDKKLKSDVSRRWREANEGSEDNEAMEKVAHDQSGEPTDKS